MDNARQQEYNLAYCKHYVDAFRINPVRAPLVYALLPAELGSFVGHLKIGTITEAGRPHEAILATQYDLLSLRQPGIRPGEEDPAERQLIQVLQERSRAAGHILSRIIPTLQTPGWSKMPLPREVVANRRRAGGA